MGVEDGWYTCPVSPFQQTDQAKRPLQRVFEIVITGVNGLVIVVSAIELIPGPLKGLRHKGFVSLGEQAVIDRPHSALDHLRIYRVNPSEHWHILTCPLEKYIIF